MPISKDLIQSTKSWPFEEARKILHHVKSVTPEKGYILLETGYGPSGLPHIGTFGEVARTCMVRHALEEMTDIPTRLFSFSDDMDGFQKIPTNLPNQDMLAQHIGKPLTMVPDPYGECESLGHYNNAMLRRFLDSFNFDYEFQSSSEWYKSGKFDDALKLIMHHYDAIMDVILPTLGPDRRATYSPFLPICPTTGVVLQVPVLERKLDDHTIIYKDLVRGVVTDSSRETVRKIIDRYLSSGCDSVILGCTELPMLVSELPQGATLLDSTRLVAKGAVAYSLGKRLCEIDS